jgi:general stress protein 26
MSWLPDPVERLLEEGLVAEVTVIGRNGRPITHPLIPLYDGQRIYLHSSTLFSKKLEHLKRDPRIAISLSDPIAMMGNPDRATIQGTAHLIEEDPHSDWHRLILEMWLKKEPSIDDFLKTRVALPLFFERAVIQVRPERCVYWPGGLTDRPPVETRPPSLEAA